MLRQNRLALRSANPCEACLGFPSQRSLNRGIGKDFLKRRCGISELFFFSSDSPCNDRRRRGAKLIEPRLLDSQRLPIVFSGDVDLSCRQRDIGSAVETIRDVSIVSNLARQTERFLGGRARDIIAMLLEINIRQFFENLPVTTEKIRF